MIFAFVFAFKKLNFDFCLGVVRKSSHNRTLIILFYHFVLIFFSYFCWLLYFLFVLHLICFCVFVSFGFCNIIFWFWYKLIVKSFKLKFHVLHLHNFVRVSDARINWFVFLFYLFYFFFNFALFELWTKFLCGKKL